MGELKKAISGLGNINLDAIEEFQRINERYTYLTDQRDDVLKSKKELEGIIADITEEMKTIFARQFSVINEAFQQTFTELFGGGKATLELEEPEARYMRQMADKTQFIVITHRRGTMEEADVLYGVTMQEQGVSRILTINLNDVEKELHIK